MTDQEYTAEYERRKAESYRIMELNVDRKYLTAGDYLCCCDNVKTEMEKEFPGHNLLRD